MKNKMIKIFKYAFWGMIVFLLVIPSLYLKSSAFGDFQNYDYDSDSDSSYSDSSDDSYSSDGRSYFDDRDDDYVNSGSHFTPSALSGTEILVLFWMAVGGVLIFFVLIYLATRVDKKSSQNNTSKQGSQKDIYIPDRTLHIEREIISFDSSFDAHEFILMTKNLYFLMQKSWCEKDLSPLKYVLNDSLYNKSERQIAMKASKGITQVLESIKVEDAYLTCYRRDLEYEIIKVYLKSSMIDYQVEDATGNILYGDKSTRWTMRYDMTFMRPVVDYMKDNVSDGTIVCPKCGESVSGIAFGVCPNCGIFVTGNTYNFVLSDFDAIKDHFDDMGIQAI